MHARKRTKPATCLSWGRAILMLAAGTLAAHMLATGAVAADGSGDNNPVPPAPRFREIAQQLNIHHQYVGGWEHFVGGGVATLDCDGDRLPELFVAGGAAPSILLRNTSSAPGAALAFTEETPDNLRIPGVIGAYPLDVDSDGILDLMVLRAGENLLLRGSGNCRFAPFPASLGFKGGTAWTTAFSATFEPGKQLPTLAVGNYVDRDNPDGPFGACDTSWLFRPQGERYAPPFPLDPGYCTLSMLFSDWGRKGRQDLRVSNDRHYYPAGGEEQMWVVSPTPHLMGAADGWVSYKLWGMGIASRDISGDGIPEVFMTSMGDQKLQYLVPGATGPRFADATYERGTTAQRPYTGGDTRGSTGWHAQFGDAQNDGFDDIFIAKGNVDEMPDSAVMDPNNLLLQSPDGMFHEAGDVAGIASGERGRGASFADLNLDGKLDLVVVNRRADMEIYQNVTQGAGNWLEVQIMQPGINPFAVGSWLEVAAGNRSWTREITVGGGHASGAAGFSHFGLGDQDLVRLRIIWPDGTPSHWQEISANQALILRRDGNQFRAQDPFRADRTE